MDQKKEKLQKQTDQIFNITEKPIMEYIAAFLEESPYVIFNDDIPIESDPLILLPLEDYKKNIYLKFTLKVMNQPLDVNENAKRISPVNTLIRHDDVKEAIGFLLYAIKTAYGSIIASSMVNNKPMVNIQLELNENNWTVYPKYRHDTTIKKNFLEDSLSKLFHMKSQQEDPLPKEMIPEINQQIKNIVEHLNTVKKEISPESERVEEKINNEFINRPVLCIVLEEINKSQLPKQKHTQPINKLPVISSQSYADPN
jgi:hypothetical protein